MPPNKIMFYSHFLLLIALFSPSFAQNLLQPVDIPGCTINNQLCFTTYDFSQGSTQGLVLDSSFTLDNASLILSSFTTPKSSSLSFQTTPFVVTSLQLTSPFDNLTLSQSVALIGTLSNVTIFSVNVDLVHDIPTTVNLASNVLSSTNGSLEIDLLTIRYSSTLSLTNLQLCGNLPSICQPTTTTSTSTTSTTTSQPTSSTQIRPPLTTITNNPLPTLISLPCDLPISTNGRCGAQFGTKCPDNLCCGTSGYCQDNGDTNGPEWCNFLPSISSYNCQLGYGKCFIEPVVEIACPNYIPLTTNGPDTSLPVQSWVGPQGGRCGQGIGYRCADNYCCGPAGYCQDDGGNSGDAWCGQYCQSGYGKCFADSTTSPASSPTSSPTSSLTTTTISTTSTIPWITLTPDSSIRLSKDGRCGFEFGTRCPNNICCSEGGYCQDDGFTDGLDWCAPQNCQVGYGKCFATSPPVYQKSSYPPPEPGLKVIVTNRTTTTVCFSLTFPHLPAYYLANTNFKSSSWTIYANLSGLTYDAITTKSFSSSSLTKASFSQTNQNLTIVPATSLQGIYATDTSLTLGFCTKRTSSTSPFSHQFSATWFSDVAPVYIANYNNCIAITFDDGPCTYTDSLLDILQTLNATATFFVVGTKNCQIGDWYPTLRRMIQDKHQIGLHTWSHISIPYQSENVLTQEMLKNENAVFAATGIRPRYMRPPFGDWDVRSATVMAKLGYSLVSWGTTSDDWAMVDANGYYDSTVALQHVDSQLNALNPNFPTILTLRGTSILNHDVIQTTSLDFAAKLVQMVKNKGYRLGTVAECLGDVQPYKPIPTSSTISTTTSPRSSGGITVAPSTKSSTSKTTTTSKTTSSKTTSSSKTTTSKTTKTTSTKTTKTSSTKTTSTVTVPPLTLGRREEISGQNRPRRIDILPPASKPIQDTSERIVKRAIVQQVPQQSWIGFTGGLLAATVIFGVGLAGNHIFTKKAQRVDSIPYQPSYPLTRYPSSPKKKTRDSDSEPVESLPPMITRIPSSTRDGWVLSPDATTPTLEYDDYMTAKKRRGRDSLFE